MPSAYCCVIINRLQFSPGEKCVNKSYSIIIILVRLQNFKLKRLTFKRSADIALLFLTIISHLLHRLLSENFSFLRVQSQPPEKLCAVIDGAALLRWLQIFEL